MTRCKGEGCAAGYAESALWPRLGKVPQSAHRADPSAEVQPTADAGNPVGPTPDWQDRQRQGDQPRPSTRGLSPFRCRGAEQIRDRSARAGTQDGLALEDTLVITLSDA